MTPHSPVLRSLVCFLTLALTPVLSSCRPADAGARADGDGDRTYVCPPCAPHDTLEFDRDGVCPVCGMALIEKPDSSRVDHPHIAPGSGNFLVSGGPGHEEKLITVFYHRPESFAPRSPILIVVPGSGRDADEYRDAWVDHAEEHGVLVLSPRYPEDGYGFGWYHMGGVTTDVNVEEAAEFVEGSHQAVLDEEALSFDVNEASESWIFHDFDRIFETAAAAVGSWRVEYDVFGHSAGGQILHRLALLAPGTKADRIVAANAGFYTMPDLDEELPFGLEGAPVDRRGLEASLRQRLVLLLGREDDHAEAGGTFLRSPSADEQGPGRYQRGRHFHAAAGKLAGRLGAEFNWELEPVPGVGHDFEGMTDAAARYLYGRP